jgi:hypothetical protein
MFGIRGSRVLGISFTFTPVRRAPLYEGVFSIWNEVNLRISLFATMSSFTPGLIFQGSSSLNGAVTHHPLAQKEHSECLIK